MATTRMEQMQHRSSGLMQSVRDNAPNYRQVIGLVTVIVAGLALAGIGGLTLAGTAIGVAMLTPVLIVFSPVLIPLGTLLIMAIAGFFIIGGFGLATLSMASWIYNYCQGRNPPGSNQVDAARTRLYDTAAHLNERARDYTHNVKEYLHGTTPQPVNETAVA